VSSRSSERSCQTRELVLQLAVQGSLTARPQRDSGLTVVVATATAGSLGRWEAVEPRANNPEFYGGKIPWLKIVTSMTLWLDIRADNY